jgi:succinate dehydrogenase / fumarate reductase iron-sulfur subunit
MAKIDTKKMTFKVFRFNSETDFLPYYKNYVLDVRPEDMILDVLDRIKWEKDGSFSYRRSCRHGICGSCAVKVNGKATLACKDRVSDLVEIFGEDLVIEPQDKGRAIKDMVIDKGSFWKKYNTVQPFLVADIDEAPKAENLVSIADVEKIDEADYCIQCGNCYYSCPSVNVNEDYLGPAALAIAYRFNADVRDNGSEQRLDIVNNLGSGIWDCVKCFECAEACPKELDPIGKITKLHLQTFDEDMAENNVAVRHAYGFKPSIAKHGLLDEGELVKYSEGIPGVIKHLPVAYKMWKKGKIVMPWKMPKSKNLDEITKLVEIASTTKFED